MTQHQRLANHHRNGDICRDNHTTTICREFNWDWNRTCRIDSPADTTDDSSAKITGDTTCIRIDVASKLYEASSARSPKLYASV